MVYLYENFSTELTPILRPSIEVSKGDIQVGVKIMKMLYPRLSDDVIRAVTDELICVLSKGGSKR